MSDASDRYPAPLLIGLSVALLGGFLAVDPSAMAMFDAPKRFSLAIAGVLAMLTLAWLGPIRLGWRGPRQRAFLVIALLGLLTLCIGLSHGASNALADMRLPVLLFILLLALILLPPPAIWRTRINLLIGALMALSSLLAVAQSAGLTPVFDRLVQAGRFASSGLFGNEGHLALTAAVVGSAAFATLIARPRKQRLPAMALLLLCVLAIAINRQLTAALALAAGVSIVVLARFRRTRWLHAAMLLVLTLVVGLASDPIRERVARAAGADLSVGQTRTSFRLSAWAAAAEMIRARPLTGHGPGAFSKLAETFRLRAELRYRTRLTPPPNASGFTQAHNDYLQFAAEYGLPILLLWLAAFWVLIDRLARRADIEQGRGEATRDLAVLAALAVSALAWFPLHIPALMVLLILGLADSLRVLTAVDADPSTVSPRARLAVPQLLIGATALVLATLSLSAELSRYRAERELASAERELAAVFSGARNGDEAIAAVERVYHTAARAQARWPNESRIALVHGISALMSRRIEESIAILERAIAVSERAELTLNLGRARYAAGDAAGAKRAYLRAIWASPAQAATLPADLRAELARDLERLTEALESGNLQEPPPL